jgi:hypothetical protein
MFNLNLYFGNV